LVNLKAAFSVPGRILVPRVTMTAPRMGLADLTMDELIAVLNLAENMQLHEIRIGPVIRLQRG
jgi:hypothetical protein